MKHYLRPFLKPQRYYRVWYIGEKVKIIKSDSTYNAVRKFSPKEFTYVSYCRRTDNLSVYVTGNHEQLKEVYIHEVLLIDKM